MNPATDGKQKLSHQQCCDMPVKSIENVSFINTGVIMNVFEQDPNTKRTMQNKSVANIHEAENCYQFNSPLHMLYFSYRPIYNTINIQFRTTSCSLAELSILQVLEADISQKLFMRKYTAVILHLLSKKKSSFYVIHQNDRQLIYQFSTLFFAVLRKPNGSEN